MALNESASTSNPLNDVTTPAPTTVNPEDVNFRNNYENGISLNNTTPQSSTTINGIRSMEPTFQRRTTEGSRFLRNSLQLVMEEIRPFMEQARTQRNRQLQSQISQPVTAIEQQNIVSTGGPITVTGNNNNSGGIVNGPTTSTNTEYGYNNDYVINVDGTQSPENNSITSQDVNVNISRQNSVPDHLMTTPPSPNNNNNNNNNTNDDTSDPLRHVPEALETFTNSYVPLIMLLSAKAIYDHREGILNLIALFITFSHSNSIVKQEVMKQGRRSITALLIVLLYIIGCILFIDYILNDEKLSANLVFAPVYKPESVWDLLCAVSISDYMLKLITVMLKIFFILVPGFVMPFQRRGKVYLFLEAVSQFYRSLLPIQLWIWFLLDSYQGAERVMGVLLAAAYMLAKGADLAHRLKLIKTACHKLFQNVSFGSAATKEQLRLAGEQCPICHDIFSGPVALQPCKHVFCETCVCAWLDREPTCPLCRAQITDDPAWRDGSTTHCIQLY